MSELQIDWLGAGRHLAPTEEDHADIAALIAGAQEAVPQARSVPAGFFQTEGAGSFILRIDDTSTDEIPTIREGDTITAELAGQIMSFKLVRVQDQIPSADRVDELFKFVSAVRQDAPDGSPGMAIQRTWFAHYAAVDRDGKPADSPRGVVTIIPGMFGTPRNLMSGTALALRRDGWHVLQMLAHPSRMTEHYELRVQGDTDAAAVDIAGVLDDRSAETAYAVQAALAYLADEHDELAALPHAVIGYSGGALMLPAVVALQPERFDSAVIVAGGANVLEILDTSNYTSWINAINVDWSGSTAPRSRLYSQYLEHSRLDPFHAAPAMLGMPMLMLHADGDQAVPAASGERLWEALGRPERWRFPFGHEFLFLAALPANQPALLRWLDRHTPQPAPSTGLTP